MGITMHNGQSVLKWTFGPKDYKKQAKWKHAGMSFEQHVLV